ncbi:MAG: hypothetical protein AAF711_00585 [Planctomycetota bacterium]
MPPTDKQLTTLTEKLDAAITELATTTTVLKQHIVEVKGERDRRDRWEQRTEEQIRELETFAAHTKAVLVDDAVAHADFARLEEKVDNIGLKVASWSGGVAAIVSLVGFAIKYLVG